MTKEERNAAMEEQIDSMIDKFKMVENCNIPREEIKKIVRRGMVLNNFAFVLADVANTFLMDCERDLRKLGVAFGQKDKYNFKMMLDHVKAAKKWAEISAMPIYHMDHTDDACSDSDWWYNFIKLVDDRTGDNYAKTNLILEYLLNMPSETGLFDIKYDNFKTFKKDEMQTV